MNDINISGYLNSLTAQQREALDQVKETLETVQEDDTGFARLKSLRLCTTLSSLAEEALSYYEGEKYLLRMLRATMKDKSGRRIFQPEKAVERLLLVLSWKREFKVHPELEPPRYKEYRQVLPWYWWRDYKARTIVFINRMGEFSNVVNTTQFTKAEWFQFVGYENAIIEQELHNFSEELGEEIAGFISISDVSGIGRNTTRPSHISLLKSMADINGQNFPELAKRIILLNTPWIFPKVYSVIKAILDPITVAKFELYSKVPISYFREAFDVNYLPKEFGGDNEHSLSHAEVYNL